MNVGARRVVAIIDDDAAMRESIIFVLDSVGLSARGFASAQDFLRLPDPAGFGCLVMDVRMPGMSGIEAQRRLQERGLAIPVVFITGHGDIEMAVAAMKQGATDFLTKPFRDQTLIDAVQVALDAAVAVPGRLPGGVSPRQAALRQRLESLTPREHEVLAHVANGLRSKQIAAALGVSVKTIEEHRSHILSKMQVASSCELTAVVASLGIHLPGE